MEHQSKELLSEVLIIGVVVTLTIDASLSKDIGRKERTARTHKSQHMSHNTPLSIHRHHHERCMAGTLSGYAKQAGTVKEVVVRHGGQVVASGYDSH